MLGEVNFKSNGGSLFDCDLVQPVTGFCRHRDSPTVNPSPVAARIFEAIGDQIAHTLLAHVGKVHRRTGRVLGIG
jgi:hypothetical protein